MCLLKTYGPFQDPKASKNKTVEMVDSIVEIHCDSL